MNKLFLPQGNPQMTAQEVERRWQEFMRATQPIVEPAEPERNGRILGISWDIAMKAGWFGDFSDMPQALAGKKLDFSYDNPIEDARKQGLLLTFEKAMQTTQMATDADPTARARFDVGTAYDETMAAIAPADWMLDPKDPKVKANEEQIAQQQQQQAAIDQAAQMASVAKDAGLTGQQGGAQQPKAA